jgi:hypothetical protein
MSNVIDFLERMGQDAQLRHASKSEVELALADAEIDPELHAAILAGDQAQMEVLLGHVNVCCMVQPGKEDDDEDTEEGPSREDEEITTHFASRAMGSVA